MAIAKRIALEHLNFDDPKALDTTRDALIQGIAQGKSVGEIIDLGCDIERTFYELAYNMYQQGAWKAAASFFRIIFILRPKYHPYALGFALSLYQLKDYENAAAVFGLAFIDDPRDLGALYYAAECAWRIGKIEEAKELCTRGLALIDTVPLNQETQCAIAYLKYMDHCIKTNQPFNPVGENEHANN